MSIEKLRTEERREQITQTALNLIAAQGMRELKIAGLSRRVGVAPSAIYHHFKNKDEVIDAVLDLLQEKLLGNVNAVIEETQDPIARLKHLLIRHVKVILEYNAMARILFSEEVYGGKPERKARMHTIVTTYLDEVASIIQEGQQQNRIRPELNAATLSVMFLGLIQPTAILYHLSNGQFNAAKHVEKAWPIFCEAIGVR
jgi:AcrR family transcriptional regulator